jgi:hypothetical protein
LHDSSRHRAFGSGRLDLHTRGVIYDLVGRRAREECPRSVPEVDRARFSAVRLCAIGLGYRPPTVTSAAPLQFLILLVAGWIGRRQGEAIEYLRAENRVLRARLGPKRLRFADAERRLLAQKGKPLGRKLLAEVASLATPETILRWYREQVAAKYDGSWTRGRPRRPATPSATIRAWATSSPSLPAIRPRPSAASDDAKGSAVCSLSMSEAPRESVAIDNWDITGVYEAADRRRRYAGTSMASGAASRLILGPGPGFRRDRAAAPQSSERYAIAR